LFECNLVLELLFATGLRVSELCGLKKNEIDLEKQKEILTEKHPRGNFRVGGG
jgi:site-specific recombinase XerD